MSKDVRKAVLDCAHCRVANTTRHQTQQILGAPSMDEPFDVISMDVWYPGTTKTNTPTTKNQKETLTCSGNRTGFASLAFASQIDSDYGATGFFTLFRSKRTPQTGNYRWRKRIQRSAYSDLRHDGNIFLRGTTRNAQRSNVRKVPSIFKQSTTSRSSGLAVVREMGNELFIRGICVERIAGSRWHQHHPIIRGKSETFHSTSR